MKDFVLICKVMICQKACTCIYAAPLTLIPYLQKRKAVVCLQINAVYFLSIFFSNEINNNIFILLILSDSKLEHQQRKTTIMPIMMKKVKGLIFFVC